MIDLLAELNKQQKSAVIHKYGPLLVVAGAGTGKTGVITRRIAWLIEQGLAKPEEILALTFTDKAAREMEERVDILLPYGVVSTNIMTFHALGDSLLRQYGAEIGLRTDYVVMPQFAQTVFLQQLLDKLPLKYYKPMGSPFRFIEELIRIFSRLKDENITPQEFNNRIAKLGAKGEQKSKYDELAKIYKNYVASSYAQGKLDFGDQIMLCCELFTKRPHIRDKISEQYKFILVDEYQDTNTAQNMLLIELARKNKNIMVVGDDDQSIYRFRGAALENIMSFQKKFPKAKQIVLTQNYRSTKQILDLSYRLIQFNNPHRLEVQNHLTKKLTSKKGGQKPVFREFSDLHQEMTYVTETIQRLIKDGVSQKNIAILLRKNNQAKLILPYLHRAGIAVMQNQTVNLFEKSEIKFLVNFINIINDESNSAALYGLLQNPHFHLDIHELAILAAKANSQRVSLYEFLLNELETDDDIHKIIKLITEYREKMAELAAGEFLYSYLQESKFLPQLVKRAENSSEAALQIQNISQFFEIIREFESVSQAPTLHSFWQYLDEIHASAADILAKESPLDQNAVVITTIHKAKGLEFDAVFIIDMVQNTFPATRRQDTLAFLTNHKNKKSEIPADWHIEEERRLFYVALTRAKQYLYVSSSHYHGGVRTKKVSQFVYEAFGKDITPLQTSASLISLNALDQFKVQPKLPFNPLSMLLRDGWIYLSTNQIADYIRSPREFWYFNILNLPKGPFHSLVYGSTIHACIEHYYRAKLAKQPIALKDLYTFFNESWRSEGFVSLAHEQARKAAAKKLLRRFYSAQEKLKRYPMSVEEPFLMTIPKLKLKISGRYDAVYNDENGIEIRDFKTGEVDSDQKARQRLKENPQLAIYAYAWDKSHDEKTQKVSLHFLEHDIIVENKTIDHQATLQLLSDVVKGIKNKQFDANGKSQLNFEKLL